jgi:uncharacterized protein YdaU (DUF1376 family)
MSAQNPIVPIGHNGGPDLSEAETPIDDGHDFKMRWVRIHIGDFLQGMRGLTFEERGFYWTALLQMYDRMEPLPDDDRQAAMLLGCDIRTYRRLKLRLVTLSKFVIDEKKRIHNERVDHEIERYVAEAQRKRAVALRREEERRERERLQKDRALVASVNELHMRTDELPANFGRTSGELPAEVREKFLRTLPEHSQHLSKKPNEINVCTTTRLVSENHSSGALQNTEYKSQNTEKKEELHGNARRLGTVVAHATTNPSSNGFDDLSRRLLSAAGPGLANPAGAAGLLSLTTPMMWIREGASLDEDILPTIHAKSRSRPASSIRSWDFFTTSVAEAKARRERGLPAVTLPSVAEPLPRDERKPVLTIEFAKGRHYVTAGDVRRIQAGTEGLTADAVERAARVVQARLLNGAPKSALAIEDLIAKEAKRLSGVAKPSDEVGSAEAMYSDWRTSGQVKGVV